MSTPSSRRTDGGFTLAEVLIAIALLGVAGISATALLAQLTNSTIDGRTDVTCHATAVAVMESLLVRDYDQLLAGTTTGTSPAGVAWTVTISDEATSLRRLDVAAVQDDRTVRIETLVADR